MKRLVALMASMLFLTGCAKAPASEPEPALFETAIQTEAKKEDVRIKFPKNFMSLVLEEGETADDMFSGNEKFKEYTVNEDGSVYAVVSAEKYDEILTSTRQTFDDTMQEQCPEYKTVESVTGTDDLKEITVNVTSEEDFMNSYDFFICYSAYFSAGLYRVFSGDETASVTCHFVDNGNEFKTSHYPDDFDLPEE